MADTRDTKFFQWYLELNTNSMYAIVAAGDGETREVPFAFEVCHVCRGRGQYVNPNLDRHGLSREDLDQWEPEEIQDYRNGEYNVQCGYCEGRSVIPVTPDKEVLNDLTGWESSMAEWQSEIDSESRMLGEY